ncbi:DUF4062 domain-containing protein [Paenibacillus sp. FSL H3-0286]|uniref:DUF4062 domain-containing protein n=1 Tax=Paenibacillus sp. FSL H3-0286 TaxID=2921427 RepID=UPI00324A76DF
MKKKLQVFISSTYKDMIEEREAAVSAVLNAGHIPAGMELFKSADKSQKTTIQKWIQESDVYMLILGGRYGSIDEETGKSYTHWEYDYAGELGKRRFAVVIDDKRLDEKARENKDYLERENYAKYNDFKAQVLGNISKFYEDLKDIRLATMESLKDYEEDDNLVGWVKADQVGNVEETLRENTTLLKENAKLKADFDKLKEHQKQKVMINGWNYEELKETLDKTILKLPKEVSIGQEEVTLLEVFVTLSDDFITGITNSTITSEDKISVYYEIAPKLILYGMLEKIKIAGVKYERIQTTKDGLKFLAKYNSENLKNPEPKAEPKKPTNPVKRTRTKAKPKTDVSEEV